MANISDVNHVITVFDGQHTSIICTSSGANRNILWTALPGSEVTESCFYKSVYTCVSRLSFTPTQAINGSSVSCSLDDKSVTLIRQGRLFVSDGKVCVLFLSKGQG